jgi:hypothetical protein
VHDTWAVRDLPVLDATVGLLEHSYMVTVTDIAVRTGLDPAQVARSLEALDPVYVDFRKTTTGGDPRYWYVFKVTPEARRAVGQWPTAESLISALADELYAASHLETGDERQSLLAYAARLIGDTVRDLATTAAARVLSPALSEVTLPEPEPLPVPVSADRMPVGTEEASSDAGPDAPDTVAEAAQPDPPKPEAAKTRLTRFPPSWPDAAAAWPVAPDSVARGSVGAGPAAAGSAVADSAEPEPGSPDLVPLPEPTSFPTSLAGRRTTAQRAAVGRSARTATVTEPDAADADQNPGHAPGDAANAS